MTPGSNYFVHLSMWLIVRVDVEQPALPFAGNLVPTARLMDVPRANICLHIPVAPPRRSRAANQNALRTWTPFQRGLWSKTCGGTGDARSYPHSGQIPDRAWMEGRNPIAWCAAWNPEEWLTRTRSKCLLPQARSLVPMRSRGRIVGVSSCQCWTPRSCRWRMPNFWTAHRPPWPSPLSRSHASAKRCCRVGTWSAWPGSSGHCRRVTCCGGTRASWKRKR